MRNWLLPVLRCVRCRSDNLMHGERGVECRSCGARFAVVEDVTDFLDRPHPKVQREIEAVATLDSADPAMRARIQDLLVDLVAGRVDPADSRLEEFPSFCEFFGTRRRARRVLRRFAPGAGRLAVELGADHCLLSGTLLEAGYRVVATDITDHLHFAPEGSHVDLARVKADMNRLPIGDGVADLVWATACVHHSWTLEGTFREARRVLSPGGHLVLLSEPMPAWPRFLMYGLGRRFGREQRELGINENLHPRSVWLRAAKAAGFEPRLVFPTLSDRELLAKLGRYRLPGAWLPLIRRSAGLLQVSIHMVAEIAE